MAERINFSQSPGIEAARRVISSLSLEKITLSLVQLEGFLKGIGLNDRDRRKIIDKGKEVGKNG